ncbi:hypothetical protein HPP92_019371 [Vanilla planifolia]|uniref:Bulb-type lectin domain-containing protein n=1 Tax=Vanilla planifolia TaxID=51239 RepID=A0A835QCC4_VANPL|nr:hypothetical protein HPP92_019371 [Vanilla planifolia]
MSAPPPIFLLSSLLLLPLLLLLFLPHSHLASADHVLYTDEVLLPSQNLTNGPHVLSIQPHCRLVLSTAGATIWATNATSNSGDCYLAVTQKGELVLRRAFHYAVWSSGAKATKKGKYALVLDAEGRIAVYGHRRWSTSNPKSLGSPDEKAEEAASAEYVIHSGHKMAAGEKLRYREYELAFSKCNLVINDTRTGRWLWQTNTKEPKPPPPAKCFVELESSGELSVKSGNHRLWSSNKRTDSGRHIAVLRFDGRLAVYGPLVWANVRLDDSTAPDAVREAGAAFVPANARW